MTREFCTLFFRGCSPALLNGDKLLVDIDESTDLQLIKALFDVSYKCGASVYHICVISLG